MYGLRPLLRVAWPVEAAFNRHNASHPVDERFPYNPMDCAMPQKSS
jgi:hypothetical protein